MPLNKKVKLAFCMFLVSLQLMENVKILENVKVLEKQIN